MELDLDSSSRPRYAACVPCAIHIAVGGPVPWNLCSCLLVCLHMSYSLNSFKGGYIGDYIGEY